MLTPLIIMPENRSENDSLGEVKVPADLKSVPEMRKHQKLSLGI
jgi:hypothetical protein